MAAPKKMKSNGKRVMDNWQLVIGNFQLPITRYFAGDKHLKAFLLSLGWLFITLACNLPLLNTIPAATHIAPIIWWTNTPTAEVVIESTPTPAGSKAPNSTSIGPVTRTPNSEITNTSPHLYYTQSGDTLEALATRFSVLTSEITSPDSILEDTMIDPGQLLVIPRRLSNTTPSYRLLPDSEVVFSPTALNFDVDAFVNEAGGYLSTYREYLGSTGWTSGAEIVKRVALENSINPLLLLSLLAYQCGCVYGTPTDQTTLDYPIGYTDAIRDGLFAQLVWSVNQLSIGYYGWREGILINIVFSDGVTARLDPELNAGTIALQYFLAQLYDSESWLQAINPDNGIAALHDTMFGSSWGRAAEFEPLFPPLLFQPTMILPFWTNQIWSYSGGPHGAWEKEGSRAALDFSPGSVEPGCAESDNQVVAATPGLVVRSERGVIVLDLDGDGHEQTGWALVYLHISTDKRIPAGSWVTTGKFLGNPSCEGGRATGTHLHIARKYNGEWISADGPLPFTLSGWIAGAGDKPYEGTLSKGDRTIVANPFGTFDTRIIRESDEP